MSESSTLRSFDAFPKVNTAYKRQSTRGGLATLVIGVLCFYFLCSELRGYSNGHEEHIYTVTKDLAETIQLNVDVTVAMPCKSIKVIAQDYSEDTFFAHELLNMQGLTYDFGTDRMQHEIHSHKAYEMNSKTLKKSKFKHTRVGSHSTDPHCRISGSVPINHVEGALQIFNLPDNQYFINPMKASDGLNLTHAIHELSFGDYFPKVLNPLDGVSTVTDEPLMSYQYFLSAVPVEYSSGRKKIHTYQYAVKKQTTNLQEHFVTRPAIFFHYKYEPVTLKIQDSRETLTVFVVKLLSILGGFVVCGSWIVRGGEKAYEKIVGKKLNYASLHTGGLLDRKS
ncbi:endoplasmic reticulum vesicle transporter-domain-containing protein [Yarrowia lipolytica]|jgi:hypothetical protein|uniref:Endoplasmic reticulum-Golgi intermediate compartment protein n=2 Tax=Yarrowia lipolytica TaxID=4952 RepID=Q6CGP1_YARLI|nr:YALI0A17600p [Yarrowia lipolytica CLIB122]AOW00783.1 hypothetical protein YALI1_A17720g [Yarrowia lipolytica]KAB8281337.1 endoplasmic reticulum vesicle transporter-domain-containing protein [Yarrowia lipolytica]KAE8169630.1 endoplasmic reticulum vesicle transporter-domain-containing protein [Yarrowia lipolytica]KAJ8051763.1 endoplasmic reticulum vesicle transporter-domain-containing protein [Yarrowia lipolytica]QNP95428.1 ER-derived vesicles protein 41 [Yarrowia lipolytica]|eukprot:XP_500171.1 YALI0A17600p [Yarrowia lipolytica CLIB122]